MVATLHKPTVTLGGVPIAATTAHAWKLISGVRPYTAAFTVHSSQWNSSLSKQQGKPLDLLVVDSRGEQVAIKSLYIMHQIASDSPHRVSFLVADVRWQWDRKIIARDYNITRKTGNITRKQTVPVETQASIEQFDYKPYSLQNGERLWTSRNALTDVVYEVTKNNFILEGWPVNDGQGKGGELTLQNIMLRDPGSVAISRLLAYIPGADIYIDTEGKARIYNAADLDAASALYKSLPAIAWDGDTAAMIDRKAIRPSEIVAYYQREVECVLEYSDDYGTTTASLNRDRAYVENVVPTVDLETTVTEYDPVLDRNVTKTVPPGTWVTMKAWLAAMDADKVQGSWPWTFDTIKKFWYPGRLEAFLGGGVLDRSVQINNDQRIKALQTHFRQTFRINRRIMERVRDIKAVRIAVLDPVTGDRAPSAVWGQATYLPSAKGKMARPIAGNDPRIWITIDGLPAAGAQLSDTPPSPAIVSWRDRELGIFGLQWKTNPYGTTGQVIPCLVKDHNNITQGPIRDLSQQLTHVVVVGAQPQGHQQLGIFLSTTMQFKCMVTIMPVAPNNKAQFHAVRVRPAAIRSLYREAYGIENGDGPALEVFVPPGEATSLWAWDNDGLASDTIGRLLGLDSPDPTTAGLVDDPNTEDVDESHMIGFKLINEQRVIRPHSVSVAAEMMAPFADSLHGSVHSVLQSTTSGSTFQLRGNMSAVSLQIAAAPSGKISTRYDFPGQQRPISRFGVMPETARYWVLGIVKLGHGE